MSGIIGKNASRSSGVIGTSDVGIASLAADSSPQLGGFLDAAGNYIQLEKGGDISSASPTVIDTDGDFFAVTGTTNFSAFTVAADRHFFLEFGGALTMTHGNGTLDLPGAANITTAASDVGEFVSTAANVVTCVNYTKRDGTAVVLADNSITLAKMAGGTDGNIISYDAAGDPVAIATGDDGQVLTSAGAGAPPVFEDAAAGGDSWTQATPITTASGTSITFGSLPAGLSMIYVHFDGTSTDSTGNMDVQIGDGGGIETGGYTNTYESNQDGTHTFANSSDAFTIFTDHTGDTVHGHMVLARLDSGHEWTMSHTMRVTGNGNIYGAGSKDLSAELTQVLIKTSSGNFDAGRIGLSYI